MFNSLLSLFAAAKSRKPSGHKRCYSKPGLRFERLEARDTPAAMAFDVHNNRSRGEKEPVRFEVADVDYDNDRVMKKTNKLHALTAKNLSPGNYAGNHGLPAHEGLKVLSRR